MFNRVKKIEVLNKKLDMLNNAIRDSNIIDFLYLIGNKKEIIKRNFLAGIFRGVGIGIGVTIITAIIVLILERIVRLNLPVIGEFITDIVDIVERNRY